MGDAPASKRPKMQYGFKKPNYYAQRTKKYFIDVGQKGFLATCNYREKDCIRECYNILNQYADTLYGAEESTAKNHDSDKEDDDIADSLQKEITASKIDPKQARRFQVVDTGANNCIFIKTTLKDPVELGHSIAKDISENKTRRTRHLLRLVPIDLVCKANTKNIIDAAGSLFDKHFLKEPKTFSVAYNKRYNNDIKRDDIIKELAELVASKNVGNKVDLKNAETTVVVEIIKGLCCLSVIPNYLKLKKYNLSELANRDTDDPQKKEGADEDAKTEGNGAIDPKEKEDSEKGAKTEESINEEKAAKTVEENKKDLEQ